MLTQNQQARRRKRKKRLDWQLTEQISKSPAEAEVGRLRRSTKWLARVEHLVLLSQSRDPEGGSCLNDGWHTILHNLHVPVDFNSLTLKEFLTKLKEGLYLLFFQKEIWSTYIQLLLLTVFVSSSTDRPWVSSQVLPTMAGGVWDYVCVNVCMCVCLWMCICVNLYM